MKQVRHSSAVLDSIHFTALKINWIDLFFDWQCRANLGWPSLANYHCEWSNAKVDKKVWRARKGLMSPYLQMPCFSFLLHQLTGKAPTSSYDDCLCYATGDPRQMIILGERKGKEKRKMAALSLLCADILLRTTVFLYLSL